MDWLTALQSSLFVAVLVAGAYIGLQQGTVRTLRASNGDLRDSNSDLEKGRQDDRKRIADLEGAVRVLNDAVTAKDEIHALTVQLNAHHQESIQILTTVANALTKGAT